MRKIIKRTIAVLAFLCILAGTFYRINHVLEVKGDSTGYLMEMYYAQDEGTIDVLNIGSSHMYANVNPAVLWDEYGIASYNLGAGLQSPWNSYYYLKEALEYQTPKLIVMDVFGVTQTIDYQPADRVAMNTLGLKWSDNYKDNVAASLGGSEKDYRDFCLKFPVYHNRYNALTETDFTEHGENIAGKDYKGYPLNCISTSVFGAFVDVETITDTKELTPKCYEYFTKTIELAKEAEIPLLLVVNPYMGITYEEKKIYNMVEEIAKDYGVDYIDFNECCEEIGFDLSNDFAEAHHLNYNGAERFSSYYGAYIKEHYEIPDHRGQAEYASWDVNSDFYAMQAENVALAKITTEDDYLKKLFDNSERYTIGLSFIGDYYNESRSYIWGLADRGLDPWNEHRWIIENGEVIYHVDYRLGIPDFYKELGESVVTVQNGTIYIGQDACTTVDSGLNIVVYDNELEKVVDACGINSEDGMVVRE